MKRWIQSNKKITLILKVALGVGLFIFFYEIQKNSWSLWPSIFSK